MNYLAHLALSNWDEEIMVGNMIEDFITGRIDHPRNAFLTPKLKIGVKLHRAIDTFTDSNEIVNECKKIFYPSVGKYASVVVDVYFDYFLLKNWNLFYDSQPEVLYEFVYQTLPKYKEFYPEKLKNLVDSLVKHRWLGNYEFEWGLIRALQNIESRINRPTFLTQTIDVFNEHKDLLNDSFVCFYPKLIENCEKNIILFNSDE